MAIELVIKIPEEIYKNIQSKKFWLDSGLTLSNAYDFIMNGTVLKEHGDLVDRDAINNRFNAIWDELETFSNKPTYKELLDKLSMCLDTAGPIIKDNYEEIEEKV